MYCKRCCYILGILLVLSVKILASDSLIHIRTLPIKARFLTVDETGNAYLIRNDNALLRYDENGDSTGIFRSVQNGNLGFVDALNPLRLLLYYPEYSKLVLLDRMLTPRNELDLRKLGIMQTPVVASSADGNLWIYDQFNARLHKVDDQLREVYGSNDLRQETGVVPSPVFLTERDWKLYMSDTTKGIFVFDRYGNYVNTLSIPGISYCQIIGTKIIWLQNDTLIAWDMQYIKEQKLALPGLSEVKIKHAAILRDRLYVLYEHKMVWYRIREGDGN